MTGFTDITPPEATLNGSGGIEQAKTDLLQLMGQNVDEPEEEVSADEPEQGEAEQAEAFAEEDLQERPEEEASQGAEDDELLAPEFLDRKVRFRENGEDVERTVKGLIEGFQLQSSNKRTAQELAQERQRLEAQFGEITQQRDHYGNLLEQQQAQLEALIPEEPDWGALASQSPDTYHRQKAAWDQLQGQLSRVKQERQRVYHESQQTYQQQLQQHLQREQEALLSKRNDLRDQEKQRSFFQDVASFAQHEFGINPQELSMINDHRLWLIADMARKYVELQSGGESKRSGDKKIPTLKGGKTPDDKPSSRQLREARSRFNKTGDTRDAAKLFEYML